MVKIFIGNLVEGGLVTSDDIRPLFEAHGTVTECEIMKNHGYGYVFFFFMESNRTIILNGVTGLYTWTRSRQPRLPWLS